MVASDAASADFARVNLFSLWANGCRGMSWWCSSDQTELTHPPYDWIGVELKLGLLRNDGTSKPVLEELSKFRAFLDGLSFDRLPRRRTDAICLLTKDQDDWAAAYGTFTLSKQAGLEIEFRHVEQPIPDAQLYLLPSLKGPAAIPRRRWAELIDSVRSGATLYVSLDDGIVPFFNAVAGVEVIARSQGVGPTNVRLDDGAVLNVNAGQRLLVENRTAEVLGRRAEDGSPLFWRHRLGEGTVVVLAVPLEVSLTTTPGAFADGAAPYWRIYAELLAARGDRVLPTLTSPKLAVTEHRLSATECVVIVINHGATAQSVTWPTARSLESIETLRGEATLAAGVIKATVPAFDAIVMRVAVHA